jgi:hypothetical protein
LVPHSDRLFEFQARHYADDDDDNDEGRWMEKERKFIFLMVAIFKMKLFCFLYFLTDRVSVFLQN